MRSPHQWTPATRADLFERMLTGETLQSLAIGHGVTRQRIMQILTQTAKRMGSDGAYGSVHWWRHREMVWRTRLAEYRKTHCTPIKTPTP